MEGARGQAATLAEVGIDWPAPGVDEEGKPLPPWGLEAVTLSRAALAAAGSEAFIADATGIIADARVSSPMRPLSWPMPPLSWPMPPLSWPMPPLSMGAYHSVLPEDEQAAAVGALCETHLVESVVRGGAPPLVEAAQPGLWEEAAGW